jgi:hypothetical protein
MLPSICAKLRAIRAVDHHHRSPVLKALAFIAPAFSAVCSRFWP